MSIHVGERQLHRFQLQMHRVDGVWRETRDIEVLQHAVAVHDGSLRREAACDGVLLEHSDVEVQLVHTGLGNLKHHRVHVGSVELAGLVVVRKDRGDRASAGTQLQHVVVTPKVGLTASYFVPRAMLTGGEADRLLAQEPDTRLVSAAEIQVVTKREPTKEERHALLFAWRVVKHVKSNAIVFARADAAGSRTLGVGAGQMSRVDAARIAVWKAGEAGLPLAGSVVASDAFFPFADGIVAAAEAGATAAIQPGGSVRDAEVIAAADARNMAMVFTGIRHFRH